MSDHVRLSVNVSVLAKHHADALDRLVLAQSFCKNISADMVADGLRVAWTAGSSMAGYKEICEAVTVCAREQVEALLAGALADMMVEVQRTRKELMEALDMYKQEN